MVADGGLVAATRTPYTLSPVRPVIVTISKVFANIVFVFCIYFFFFFFLLFFRCDLVPLRVRRRLHTVALAVIFIQSNYTLTFGARARNATRSLSSVPFTIMRFNKSSSIARCALPISLSSPKTHSLPLTLSLILSMNYF